MDGSDTHHFIPEISRLSMNTIFDELGVVRIAASLEADREISGTKGVGRAPSVGDLATVVHVLEPGRSFIAEAVLGRTGDHFFGQLPVRLKLLKDRIVLHD